MARPVQSSAWLLLASALLFASGAAAQANCSSAKFPSGRLFELCTSLPVLGASLHWTYHPGNGTADVAFRAQSGANGWVAWGINTERPNSMGGSSVLIASQNGSGGVVSVLPTFLESTSPSLTPGTLRFNLSGAPAAEYSAGAYTIYATVALPGNSTLQNTVWQAGPLVNGQVAPHPISGPNLRSTLRLDFLSGGNRTTTGAPNSRLPRRNLRGFQG